MPFKLAITKTRTLQQEIKLAQAESELILSLTQGRAGQGRAGQGRAGQGRAGQGRASPAKMGLGGRLQEGSAPTHTSPARMASACGPSASADHGLHSKLPDVACWACFVTLQGRV